MYSEIEFINSDTDAILNRMVQGYEELIGGKLYPADPKKLMIEWIAKIISHERVIMNETAKQNLPRFAKGKYLDELSGIFVGVERLKEQHARSMFEFTLSAAQAESISIPKGTRISVDGDIMFLTMEHTEIEAGKLTATVLAECNKPGAIGNDFEPGQITELIDIFPFYQSVRNTTTSDGGADKESDRAYYERMKESTDAYSTAGPEGAYKYHAKSASALVGDVTVEEGEGGQVNVKIITTEGELPGEELIRIVKEKLSKDTIRPLTDKLTVSAPETINFDVDLTYYIPKNMNREEAEAEANIIVDRYIKWQTTKLGRDINPSYLIGMLMNTGIKRVEIRQPTFQKLEERAVAKLRNKSIVNGGAEDE